MPTSPLHHFRFEVSDLDKQEKFAKDFGLIVEERTDQRLVMRTRGGDQCCYVADKGERDGLTALAFAVDEEADLERSVRENGAREVGELDLPGGGKAVSLTDPDSNEVLLVHGSERIEPGELYPELVLNTPFRKERFGRNQTRRAKEPARLWRIGHMALFVKSFAATRAWYEKNVGLIGSDVYHIPGTPQAEIVGFFRLNRGDEYVDHHVIAFMQDDRGGCHHISFEVQDYEAQHTAHCFLKRQNYESIWGVGRHPHGSHVFDVWRSPDGARFETFSDTDLFRASDGTNLHDISQVMMDEWLDDSPERYFA